MNKARLNVISRTGFIPSKHNRKIKAYKKGIYAETIAALYFKWKGYKIIERRFKCKLGEIDLVLRKANTVVFVEVKTRHDKDLGLEAITPRNRNRVVRAAHVFLSMYPQYAAFDLRFDALSIVINRFGVPSAAVHLDNAWPAGA